ncbi:MAG: ABC transporter ATP-binding protein [Solirubrobacterales bacterium]
MSAATDVSPTAAAPRTAPPLLEARGLRASYGAVEALHGIDLYLERGETIVVLGANGAGKTTLLRSICRLVSTKGELDFDGESVVGRSATAVIRKGIATVPQGRGTLTDLSVEDNLRAGAYLRKDRGEVAGEIARWYEAFPRLGQRRRISAGSLSGGEQQMLAVARALMSRPRLLLLDEPSLGLAPLIVEQVYAVLADVQKQSQELAIVLVEQNANIALELANRAYVLEAGQIAIEGTAAELHDNEAVRRAYLGY